MVFSQDYRAGRWETEDFGSGVSCCVRFGATVASLEGSTAAASALPPSHRLSAMLPSPPRPGAGPDRREQPAADQRNTKHDAHRRLGHQTHGGGRQQPWTVAQDRDRFALAIVIARPHLVDRPADLDPTGRPVQVDAVVAPLRSGTLSTCATAALNAVTGTRSPTCPKPSVASTAMRCQPVSCDKAGHFKRYTGAFSSIG